MGYLEDLLNRGFLLELREKFHEKIEKKVEVWRTLARKIEVEDKGYRVLILSDYLISKA